MKLRSLAVLTFGFVIVIGFTCGSDERKEAKASCHAQCEAQQEQGCGIGLRTCKDLCNSMISNMKAECVPLAKESFDCNLEHDEVCGMQDVCAEKGQKFAECLFGQ